MKKRILLLCCVAFLLLTACEDEDALQVLEAHKEEMRSSETTRRESESSRGSSEPSNGSNSSSGSAGSGSSSQRSSGGASTSESQRDPTEGTYDEYDLGWYEWNSEPEDGPGAGWDQSSSPGINEGTYPWEDDDNIPDLDLDVSVPEYPGGTEDDDGEQGDTWTLPEYSFPDFS